MNCNLDELKWLREAFSQSAKVTKKIKMVDTSGGVDRFYYDDIPDVPDQPYEIIIKKRERLCQFIQQAYLVWKDLEDISYTHYNLMDYLIKEIGDKYHA